MMEVLNQNKLELKLLEEAQLQELKEQQQKKHKPTAQDTHKEDENASKQDAIEEQKQLVPASNQALSETEKLAAAEKVAADEAYRLLLIQKVKKEGGLEGAGTDTNNMIPELKAKSIEIQKPDPILFDPHCAINLMDNKSSIQQMAAPPMLQASAPENTLNQSNITVQSTI